MCNRMTYSEGALFNFCGQHVKVGAPVGFIGNVFFFFGARKSRRGDSGSVRLLRAIEI